VLPPKPTQETAQVSDAQGLLDAIRERPDDDLPRLALADWCMEQPDEATQARGEFIQLRCRAARLAPEDSARFALELRSRQLRERYEEEWLGSLAKGVRGWDFDRGLVVIELTPSYGGYLLDTLTNRPEWLWVIGVKGVLLPRQTVELLSLSAAAGKLTSLDLSDCEVGAAGVRAIASPGRFPLLSQLRLAYGRIGEEGAEALANSSLVRLTILSLFAAGVGPAGAQALANATGLKRLLSLDLGHNALREQGARAVAACSALSALRALSLSGCQIGDRGVPALIHSQALNKIERLDVTNNGLSAAATEELRERFGARVVV
jgi:uncharacterized protein (TIGR02996 family)